MHFVRAMVFALLFLLPAAASAQWLKQANAQYKKGEYNKAIPLYKKAVAKGENPTMSYFNMGNTYFQLSKLPLAIVYYRAAVDHAPDFFPGHLNLAVAYYMLEDMGKTIATLKRALELKPKHLKTNMMLASSYRRAGALPQAATLFERIYETYPEKHKVCLSLGEIYRELDDPVEATKWLLRYPTSGKYRVHVLQMLAEIHESGGAQNKAIYYLRQVCEADPKKRWSRYQLVLLLRRSGHGLVALAEAEKALELHKGFTELALLAGNMAFAEKLYARAEQHYLRAKKLGSPGAVIGLENIRVIRENRAR